MPGLFFSHGPSGWAPPEDRGRNPPDPSLSGRGVKKWAPNQGLTNVIVQHNGYFCAAACAAAGYGHVDDMSLRYQQSALGRSGGRVAGLRALWAAMLLLTLLAFGWQSFVTQTHRHFGQGGISLALSVPSPGGTQVEKGGQLPADTPDNCPICQEIAHGGAYMLPAPILFQAPAAIAAWFAVTLLLALALRQQSHAWRSRAPPLRLQA